MIEYSSIRDKKLRWFHVRKSDVYACTKIYINKDDITERTNKTDPVRYNRHTQLLLFFEVRIVVTNL